MKKRVTFDLEEKNYEIIRKHAYLNHGSIAELLREAARDYIKKMGLAAVNGKVEKMKRVLKDYFKRNEINHKIESNSREISIEIDINVNKFLPAVENDDIVKLRFRLSNDRIGHILNYISHGNSVIDALLSEKSI